MTKFYVGQRVRVVVDTVAPVGSRNLVGKTGVVVDPDDGSAMLCVEVRLDGDNFVTSFATSELEAIPAKVPTAPMTKVILDHLRKVGNISGNEANALYKCKALPRRIADLKELGWHIKGQFKKDATGQRYVRYELVSA